MGLRRVLALVAIAAFPALAMELFDFGVEVDVEPPSADQVTDVSELLGQAPQ